MQNKKFIVMKDLGPFLHFVLATFPIFFVSRKSASFSSLFPCRFLFIFLWYSLYVSNYHLGFRICKIFIVIKDSGSLPGFVLVTFPIFFAPRKSAQFSSLFFIFLSYPLYEIIIICLLEYAEYFISFLLPGFLSLSLSLSLFFSVC